jgi:hypothetical protein
LEQGRQQNEENDISNVVRSERFSYWKLGSLLAIDNKCSDDDGDKRTKPMMSNARLQTHYGPLGIIPTDSADESRSRDGQERYQTM